MSPDALFRAAMNRLIARVGEGIADAAAGIAVAAQDAPERTGRNGTVSGGQGGSRTPATGSTT